MGNQLNYRKIPKISPGPYIFQRPFLRGLSTEGYLRFKIDWASLIVESKFAIFALFSLYLRAICPSTSPRGAYIWSGDLTGGLFALPVWGAHIWRGLYMEGLIFGILWFTIFVRCRLKFQKKQFFLT